MAELEVLYIGMAEREVTEAKSVRLGRDLEGMNLFSSTHFCLLLFFQIAYVHGSVFV